MRFLDRVLHHLYWWWHATWPAVLAGALTVLAFAPLGLFPVVFVTLPVLLLRLMEQKTSRAAAWQGYAFGIGYFGAGIGWIFVTVHQQADAPVPVALLALVALTAYLSCFPALVGWLQHRMAVSRPLRLLVLIPALWLLCELLSGVLFSGFPWLTLGVSQAPWSPLAGFAPLIGAHGISALVLLVAGLFALARLQRSPWTGLLGVLVLLGGWGVQRLEWTRPQGDPVRVALVQGNIEQLSKWDAAKIINTLEIHTVLAEGSRAPLIVLPETAFPIFLNEVPPSFVERLQKRALDNRGDLLLGVPLHTPDGAQYLNSVITLGVSPPQIYSKNHLVPFGEYVPMKGLFGWLYDYMHIPMVDFRAGGSGQKPLHVAGQRLALTVCYEDVFGHELRGPVPDATLMGNVSNDAWFGNTHAAHQHLQMVQMRALETGRWWLRATNTGITAIVNEHGFVVSRIPQFRAMVLEGEAQGRTGVTPYVRWGDWPLWGGSSAVVLWAVLWRWRRKAGRRA